MTGRLYLEFCGEDHTVRPGDTLTFGRSGDLEIDDNPYLHRHLGRFVDVGGVWHLENLGRHIPLHVRDQASASSSVVAPGGRGGIVHGEFVCAFRAGPTQYELTGALETHEWATDLLGPAGLEGAETVDWGRVELNDDQRLLLLAMCERRLMDPHDTERPLTNGEGAARLGWSVTKFNRKLDHLCEKLHRAGIPGVHGGVGANASDRRRRLVEHALTVGLVDVEQLVLLDVHHAA